MNFIFDNMLNKVMISVTGNVGNDEMVFTDTNGKVFKFFHQQSCCEDVSIEDIIGDLINSPILEAEEISSETNSCESGTWTFYRFSTIKGTVTVRWLGESNGYYSEDVDYVEI